MKTIFIDFETVSNVEITLGARAYTAGAAFRAVLLAYAVDNGPVKTTADLTRIPAEIKTAMKGLHVFTAHNAVFDVCVFEETFSVKIKTFLDTASLCRYYSVPASLDGAASFFGLGRKDPRGKDLLKKLAKGPLDSKDMKALAVYGKQDAVLLRKLFNVFLKASPMDPFSVKTFFLHDDMNRVGIRTNPGRAAALLGIIRAEKERLTAEAQQKFGTYGKGNKAAPVASSAAQVKKYFGSKGFFLESIAEKELEDWLAVNERKLPPSCLALISFYRELQSRGADKLEKVVSNHLDRIYDSSIYHGAHTGRPTGGGINLLNVKRITDDDDSLPFEKSVKRVLKEAETGKRIKRLSSLLWGCLVPEKGKVLVRSDLSAIEPRVGAWLRGDENTLGIYKAADAKTGKDEYTIFGDAMGFKKAVSRNLSKIVILSACYGVGAERVRAQCRGFGVPDPGEDETKRILAAYHARNPSVKRAWYSLLDTAVQVLDDGKLRTACRLVFERETVKGKTFLCVRLPSRRVKRYADVKPVTLNTQWGPRKTFTYLNPLKNYTETMRASALYENMVQAVAVDVSFEKAFQIEKFSGVKLIIHDELNVSCTPKQALRIEKIMRAPVAWLPGMPVNSKTVVSTSFHKGDLV